MKVIKRFAWFATALAVILNVYIYTYPSLDSGKCSWSHEYYENSKLTSWDDTILSLPYFGDLYKHYILSEDKENLLLKSEARDGPRDIRMMAVGDPQLNGNWPNTPYIKRLDNFGNDYYLRHIYTLLKHRLQPDFVAMMGDLVSSQWTGDSEFYNRTRRIIQRSFPRPREQALTELEFIEKHENVDWRDYMNKFYDRINNGAHRSFEYYHNEDVYDWYNGTFIDSQTGTNTEPLFLNVTGNHDIGYGDTTFQHMARWLKLFGKVNYWIEYDNDTDHPWRIVMLDSLALDGPMLQEEFKTYTWNFIETLKRREYKGATILLTHVPMYKREGLCKDGPNFEYYNATGCHGCSPDRVGLLKSQNHLAAGTSQEVLDAVFGHGTSGIILTGHDHYGCDNYYSFIDADKGWVASKSIDSDKWIREITVRSIMGDFDGTMGIMTGHFDRDEKKWDFDYTQCKFAVQHVWWAAQVTSLLAILVHTICFFF